MSQITTYLGVRVSEREARLLSLQDEARDKGYVLPSRVREKCEAVHAAVDRFLSYEKGDMLADPRDTPAGRYARFVNENFVR